MICHVVIVTNLIRVANLKRAAHKKKENLIAYVVQLYMNCWSASLARVCLQASQSRTVPAAVTFWGSPYSFVVQKKRLLN